MDSLNSYDFDAMVNLIVRDLRKHYRRRMTQADFSRELGMSFNIVNRWENGSRQLYWADFALLCSRFQIDLCQTLTEVIGHTFSHLPNDREMFMKLTESPASQMMITSIFSRSQIHRLRNGESKLSFKNFLQLLELIFGRSERFVKFLFHGRISFELSSHFLNTKDYIQLNSRDTNFSLVRIALNLQTYKDLVAHSSDFLAKLLGISVEDIEVYLMLLTAAGAIEKSATHYQIRAPSIDTRSGGRDASRKILNLWRKRMAEYSELEDFDRARLNSAHLVYETNLELEKKIFALTNKYYIDLRALIESENGKETSSIRVMTLEFFSPLENWRTIAKAFP